MISDAMIVTGLALICVGLGWMFGAPAAIGMWGLVLVGWGLLLGFARNRR